MNKRLFNQQNLTRRLGLLSVLCAMLLMPFSAWAQTTYKGGDYSSTNNSWGDWTVTGTNVEFSSSGSSLSCRISAGQTSTIQLSLTKTQNTSEKLCALTFSPSSSKVSLVSAKIVDSNDETITEFTTQIQSNGSFRYFTATTPIEWGAGDKLVLTCQYVNETNTVANPSISGATVTTGTPYDLVVDGRTVTTANKDCVTGGTTDWNGNSEVSIVSFDPTGNKLNLCKADLSGPIQLGSSMSSLIIDINGNCEITTTDAAAISSESAADITFTTSSTGSLNLKRTEGTGLVGSNITLSYDAGLSAVIVAPTSASTLADATEANIITPYGVTIAGVQLTEANVSDDGTVTGIAGITSGTVKFTPANINVSPTTPATLTLNNATINGQIFSSIADLHVSLIGSSVMTVNTEDAAAYAFTYNGTTVNTKTLTFGAAIGAALEIKASSTANDVGDSNTFTIQNSDGDDEWSTWDYSSGNYANQITFVHLSKPYVWVAKQAIDDSNKDDQTITEYSFDSSSYTVTLSGIQRTTSNDYSPQYLIKSNVRNLNVNVTGENVVYLYENAETSRVFYYTGASGDDGSLTLTIAEGAYLQAHCYNQQVTTGLLQSGYNTNNIKTSINDMTSSGPLVEVVQVNENNENDYALKFTNVTLYDLWVNGTRVNSNNAENILDDDETPTVSFSDGTLTLNGATITTEGNDAITSGLDNLTVILNGMNIITCSGNSDYAFKGTEDGATVTFDANTTSGGTLTIHATEEQLFDGITPSYAEGSGLSLTSNGNTYTIGITSYGLTIADVPVTSQNAGGITGDGITGTVTYNATQHALTLEGATIAGSIVVTNENNLTINVKGENIINAGANSALKSETQGIPGPTITFVKAGEGECSLELNSTGVTVISTKFGGLYYTNLALVTDVEGVNYDYQFSGLGYYDSQSQSTLPVTHATITSHTAYDLWIGETQVTSANAADVLGDGKVSFTKGEGLDAAPTDTLTLNSATLTVPVKVGLPNLVIDVQGANTITTDTTCIQNIAANFVPSLTFKSTSDVVGNLTLTDTDEENYYGVISENFYSNNTSYYTISKELALVMLRYGNYTSNTSYFTAGEVHNAQLVPSYGVQVGDIQIYAGNAADVFEDGTVSFDKTTNTLTLNGANRGALSTWLEELNVELIGNNKLTEVGSYPVLRSLYDAEVTIKIQSTGATKGGLTMSQPYTDDGNFYDGNVTVNIVQPLDVISGSLTGNDGNENTVVIGESYNLWVGGNRVTWANARDILADFYGADHEGAMSFDAANNTLTVSEVGELPFGIESQLDALTIKVNGENLIYSESGAAISYTGKNEQATLTFVKDADSDLTSLTLTAYGSNENIPNKAIAGYALDNITITTPMRLTSPTSMDDMLNATSVTIADYSETYDIKIAGTTVTDANKDDVLGDGTVRYEDDTNTLLLDNATIIPEGEEWAITYSGTREIFTISLNGANTVKGGGACCAILYSGQGIGQDPTQVTSPELQFIKTHDAQPGSLTLNGISGFGNNAISLESNLVAVGDLTNCNELTYIEEGYRVWVDGLQLSEHNTVSGMTFSNNTLSLSGIVSSKNIRTSLESLTVRLTGTNKLGTIGFDGDDGDDEEEGTLTFVKNDQSTAPENSLTLLNEEGGGAIYGFSEVNIQSPLMLKTPEAIPEEWAKTPNVVISDVAEVINYDLTVAGTPVTSTNAVDVLGNGKVSYANGMLTLNGAALESGITSGLDQLKIVLVGTNSIAGTITGTTGTLYFATDASDAKLTFTTESASAVSGFTEVKYLNGLRMKSVAGGFDVSIPSDYNLMVGGKAVTSDNREDVFGDGGSVIYDGEYTLILTNAELTKKIQLSSENTLDSLYIHLAGQENTITSADNVIVATAKPNMELHFVTNGSSPGKLVYTSTNASNPTLEDAFTGFSKVSFDNELEATLSGKTITLAQKIEPIINDDDTSGKGENANVNFTDASTGMDNTSGTNLSNTIISDILFTLDDDGTKNSPDGYDGEKVVINSKMSDDALEEAMNLEPGSEDFANTFKGLTFKLPASTGTISIEAWSDCGHQMCVKIGDQTATYITLTDKRTTYNVDYTCSTDTYVYIYLPQPSSSSAPRHVRGRIGPKSGVSGGLGNISVSSNSLVSSSSSQPSSNYMLLDKMAADAVIASVIPGEGLAFNDASITDLEDDMFLAGGVSGAQRRSAPTLKISSDLPFIDMRGTSIKNMEVSRSSGPFNGVPENVFIYMPEGNTTSEKNVVIGDVCDRMELKAELPGSGVNEAKPFKVSKNFTAAQATLMRTFAAGGDDSKATIYLPYAIPQEDADLLGQFFEFKGISGDEVVMAKVTSGGLKANMPYIFQAKAGGVKNPEVKLVKVYGLPAETEGLKGVYEQTSCGGDNWYGYAAEEVGGATIGQFVKLGTGASIAPFRAYMVADGGKPSYAIRWGGVDDETTAIEEPEIKTVNERKPVEGWYTLTGARLVGQPTKPGLYIYNGRTVVVK